MNEYIPDRWQVVKIAAVESDVPVFRIFGTWYGGFVTGDSWRLNSGIEKIEDTGTSYAVYGSSGSIYRCFKGAEGMSMYTQGVFSSLKGQIERSGGIMEVVDIIETGLLNEKDKEISKT